MRAFSHAHLLQHRNALRSAVTRWHACACILVLIAICWCRSSIAVSVLTNPGVFVISDVVAQSNVPGYGAEYQDAQSVNNWTLHPGMEPAHDWRCFELTGGGSDATGVYGVCSTRFYDSYDSGYYDGGRYRLYRETTTNIIKLSEGIVPVGGYVAAGYMGISHLGLSAYPPNTDATDLHMITNGEVWYYAVRACDSGGKWSAYSAPIAGVAAHSASNNGPRIVTSSLADPVVGQSYSAGSPLARITVRGGTAPYAWSITGGAFPAGISNQLVDATGRTNLVVGTCGVTNQAIVTLRVSDNGGLTHLRTFTLFRVKPASDTVTPQPPTNVAVEVNNGFLRIRWDEPPDTDIDYYQVVRSRHPADTHMERVYLGTNSPVPASKDILMLQTMFTNAPPLQTRSIRVAMLQTESAWIQAGGLSQTFVPHPGPVPATMQQESPGAGCIRVSSGNVGEFSFRHYKIAATSDFWWSVGQIPTGTQCRMSCWVYGEGLASNTLRFKLMNYVDKTITGVVNGAWVKLSLDFAVTNYITTGTSVDGPSFYFRGPGTVYLDNVVVHDRLAPGGACGESEHVLRMWRDYTAINRPQRGAMRARYHGSSFANAINAGVLTPRVWAINGSAQADESLHIPTVLQACYRTGDNPQSRSVPWLTVNLQWTEDDCRALVEYLAGPTNTPYGALRVAHRGGIVTPWVDEFRTIYIEFGNEPWNVPLFFGFRSGFSQASGRTYGRWCNYMLQQMHASPYWSPVIAPVLGGWIASLGASGFTQAACEECPSARHVALTMYLGGWEAGYGGQVGGTTWSDDGLQQWTVYNDTAPLGKPMIDAASAMLQRLAAMGRPCNIVIYESGPSYLQNGLNGVTLTANEQAVSRRYGRTLAAAVGMFDYFLRGSYAGFKENQYYAFAQDQGLWCSHTQVHTGYRPHPSWSAGMLFNRHIAGRDMLVTTQTCVPTFDLVTTNSSGQQVVKADVPLCSVYAARAGSTYVVTVINKKLDGVHNGLDFGDGHTPVTLHLPFQVTSNVTLFALAGDLRLTNLDGLRVGIVTQHIAGAAFSNTFVINEHTGGTPQGMPPGIFLYVFGDAPDAMAPYIIRQPHSISIQEGASTNLAVDADGTPPLTYFWRRDTLVIPGTGPVLSISNAQYGDTGAYSVIVSNAFGAVTSASASVVVFPEPGSLAACMLQLVAFCRQRAI